MKENMEISFNFNSHNKYATYMFSVKSIKMTKLLRAMNEDLVYLK